MAFFILLQFLKSFFFMTAAAADDARYPHVCGGCKRYSRAQQAAATIIKWCSVCEVKYAGCPLNY